MKVNPLAATALLTLLFVSVALNLVLYHRGRQFYVQLNEVKLDPLGQNLYPAEVEVSDRPLVLFFGDSRAEAWPAPAGLDRFRFVNRGIGGQTSAQVLGRLAAHVAPLRPQVVVVQVGINDLAAIPLFADRRAPIVADCAANVEQIVARARALGATVVLTTIFPLGQVPLERRLFWSDDVAAAVAEVNTHLRSLAGEGVLVLETEPILAGPGGTVRPAYSDDLLHLAPAGYEALNRELAPILAALAP